MVTPRRPLFAPRFSSRVSPVRCFQQAAYSLGKYASAAYVSALTRGEKNLAKLESDLKFFNDVLKSESQDAAKLRTFLTNPTVSADVRIKTISDLLASQKGGADELTRYVIATNSSNLFAALSENGRLGLSEKVIEDFLQLTSAHRGEVIITITSAKVCVSILLTPAPGQVSDLAPRVRPQGLAVCDHRWCQERQVRLQGE